MAHDFAKQRAARANRAARPAHAPWLWLVSGIVIGTLVSFLVYLATLTPPPQQQATAGAAAPEPAGASDSPAEPAKPKPKPTAAAPETRPQFDFYDILRQSENGGAANATRAAETAARAAQPVEVPEPQKPAAAAATPAAKPAAATPAAATPAGVPPVASAAAPSTPKPEAPKQEAPKQEAPKPAGLAMQAGAFSRHADADRRRGEILLLGYDARIETVKSADGQTRYRVSVGPFADPEALARARRALHDVGIDTL